MITRIDTSAPATLVRGILGGGSTLIDLAPAAAPVFRTVTARDPRAGEQVHLFDFVDGTDVGSEDLPRPV